MEGVQIAGYLFRLIKGDSSDQSLIMESTAEILSRLKLLGHIRKGAKLASRTMTIQPEGIVTTIQRSILYPENRQTTLRVINEVISRSFEILLHNIQSKKESDIFQCKMIIRDLIHAQTGLNNLMGTYDNDFKFKCDLTIVIQQIVARLCELQKDYPDLFVQEPLPDTLVEKKTDTNSLP